MTDSMKCGPDGCPIRIFSDLTPAEQRVARKRIAEDMTRRGFTLEQIAKQLGVSKSTVGTDLGDFPETGKLKSTKTEANPRGAGRPKGSHKSRAETAPHAVQREAVAAKMMDMGKSTREIAAELGVGERAAAQTIEHVKIRREAEPSIDPATLSMTAQQKLAIVIKQATHRLEVEIHHRIHAEMLTWLQRQLDRYNENAKHYELILKQRKGLMKRDEYRSILSCLHPDRVQDEMLKKRYEHAFNLFTKLEKAVLDEKESPTRDSGLPKTAAEWLRRKAEVQAQRAAARAAKKSNGSQVQR